MFFYQFVIVNKLNALFVNFQYFRMKNDNFTAFDNFCYDNMTLKTKNSKDRNVYKCNIDKTMSCPINFQAISRASIELNRLLLHFQKFHEDNLISKTISWVNEKNIIDTANISSNESFCNYFQQEILPKCSFQQTSFDFRNLQNMNNIENDNNQLMDLSKIQLDKLNQIILENGIFEHIPLSVIESEYHSKFIGQFMILTYELIKNTSISKEDFLHIVNNLRVPHNLLNKVGPDYYNSAIECFKGCNATFEIDAGTINSNRQLVFVLTCLQRRCSPILFHVAKDFDGSFDSYKNTVREIVQKAENSQISIIAFVTDNLPVQIKALSHESPCSIQNVFDDMTSIIHLRCTNHLIALAFWDWMKISNELTEYENKMKNIIKVFSKQEIQYSISHKIPTICQTRWNSPFNTLEFFLINRKELIKLFQTSSISMKKELQKIKDDFQYIITTGFTQVYPLLFPFQNLTNHLQSDLISCVDAVLIIEHYLKQMKENIKKYLKDQNKVHANDLIKKIKKRLLLNKNVQIYQLASLFTLDGIVRYRKKMHKVYPNFLDLDEQTEYWHSHWYFVETWRIKKMENIDDYIKNELNEYLKILTDFNSNVTSKNKRTIQKQQKTSNQRQLLLYDMLQKDQNNSSFSNTSASSDISSSEEDGDVAEIKNMNHPENRRSDSNEQEGELNENNTSISNNYNNNNSISDEDDEWLEELHRKEIQKIDDTLSSILPNDPPIESDRQEELYFFDETRLDLAQYEEEEEKTETITEEIDLENSSEKLQQKESTKEKQDENDLENSSEKAPQEENTKEKQDENNQGNISKDNQNKNSRVKEPRKHITKKRRTKIEKVFNMKIKKML